MGRHAQTLIRVIALTRIFSDTHDVEGIRTRLTRLLETPSERLDLKPGGLLESNGSDRRLNRARRPIGDRLFVFGRAWHAHGYSLQWLIQRIPGLRDLFNLTLTLLTVQGRLYRLQLAIQETQVSLKQLEQSLREHRRLTERGFTVLNQRHDGLHGDQDFMQREIELLASRIESVRAELAGRPPSAPSIGDGRDHWYMEFEESHRGSVEDIRRRQRHYLRFVREAIPDPSAGRVLDLGCGRGDWLALLGEEGFEALGVDNNATLVNAARRAGLRVHDADLFVYLESLEPRMLAAITAFQVVEHLPLDSLLALFAEARRVLRPGGLLILETPNPENLQVGAYSFWMDPTHVRPLPPPLLHQLARHFGFIDIRIERLNPWPQYREDAESADPLNRLLYGGQDYALIARAPLSPEPAQTEHASLR